MEKQADRVSDQGIVSEHVGFHIDYTQVNVASAQSIGIRFILREDQKELGEKILANETFLQFGTLLAEIMGGKTKTPIRIIYR